VSHRTGLIICNSEHSIAIVFFLFYPESLGFHIRLSGSAVSVLVKVCGAAWWLRAEGRLYTACPHLGTDT
jgi:hypothetical protein